MKTSRRFAFILAVLVAGLVFAAAQVLVVKIQTTQLRKGPQFFGTVIAPLKAGDRLEKISESNGWIQVKTPTGAMGWVHSSAIEVPKFGLTATSQNLKTQATASEVALAGKGFNKQVEDSYKAKHAEVSFAGVDRMLQIRIALAQIEDFLKKGRLGEFRGAK